MPFATEALLVATVLMQCDQIINKEAQLWRGRIVASQFQSPE